MFFSRPICLTALEILGHGGLGLLGWIREPLTPSDDVPSVDFFILCVLLGSRGPGHRWLGLVLMTSSARKGSHVL